MNGTGTIVIGTVYILKILSYSSCTICDTLGVVINRADITAGFVTLTLRFCLDYVTLVRKHAATRTPFYAHVRGQHVIIINIDSSYKAPFFNPRLTHCAVQTT